MAAAGRVRIGTSGWHYAHWRGPFYPAHLRARDELAYYAGRFGTVEVNSTFYGLPKPGTLTSWHDAVPAGFVFACKASRFITHMKKLKEPHTTTHKFFSSIEALGNMLGPLLFQLPPHWRADPGRLDGFLAALPAGRRYVVECRDPSWFEPRVYAVLRRHDAAFCLYDLAGTRTPEVLTAPFIYLRLHGPGAAYRGRYDGRTLAGLARRIRRWAAGGRDVYAYFDNDEAGHAALDALRLKAMLAR